LTLLASNTREDPVRKRYVTGGGIWLRISARAARLLQ
jgi:hypothetical protein